MDLASTCSRSSSRLRWTSTQEWHDIYQPENLDDVQKFFDKYMKNVDNDWEKTPKYKLSLLGYNRPSVINRPETSYPPADFKYTTLYLDGSNGTLQNKATDQQQTVRYQADDKTHDGQFFTYTFSEYTELCGVSKATLFMSAAEHDDMVRFPPPSNHKLN